jgi:hypothetical protein
VTHPDEVMEAAKTAQLIPPYEVMQTAEMIHP